MTEPYPASPWDRVRVQPTPDPDIVVVLGDDAPGELSPQVVDTLVARLVAEPDLDAVGPFVPVVDAHKIVDDQDRVTEGVERSRLAHLGRPAAVRRAALESGRVERIGRS